MKPQSLEVKQELMRLRHPKRRSRKPVPHPDARSLIEKAHRRLIVYKIFVRGMSPFQIANRFNSDYGLKGTPQAIRPEHVENLIATGFRLPSVERPTET